MAKPAKCLILTVLEADYSAALTLLLRYPVPEPPYGPQSFVEDALYLYRDLSEEGGKHIISKHSAGRESISVHTSGSRRGRRVGSRQQRGSRRSLSPRMSPSRFLQEQGGIEGIIQEAARGVYSRGEKWGVAKALRGAYEGLQSASNSPKRLGSAPRWSLDTGSMTTDETAKFTARIHALEQRNINLAKLLEKAMEDLWIQQRELTKARPDSATDALSLAIAKIQFVQVYLENPTMPLPAEEASDDRVGNAAALDRTSTTDHGSPKAQSPTRAPIKDSRRNSKIGGPISPLRTSPNSSDKSAVALIIPLNSIPSLNLPQNRSGAPGSPKARPALAQSSFSWILGQEQRISDFVAASPFSTEKERARGRAGFLFGKEEVEDGKEPSPVRKAKRGAMDGREEGPLEEAITLANMASMKEETDAITVKRFTR